MDEARMRAYRIVLAQGFLHVKWELAGLLGGFEWFRPRRAMAQVSLARQAALRAYAFHNLAICSARDFEGFLQDAFWSDIESFHRKCPNAIGQYREVFERSLRGEQVHIVALDGVVRNKHLESLDLGDVANPQRQS